jgi:hypothetical protein
MEQGGEQEVQQSPKEAWQHITQHGPSPCLPLYDLKEGGPVMGSLDQRPNGHTYNSNSANGHSTIHESRSRDESPPLPSEATTAQ